MNYYSVGGGFFVSDDDISKLNDVNRVDEVKVPLEFSTGKELI